MKPVQRKKCFKLLLCSITQQTINMIIKISVLIKKNKNEKKVHFLTFDLSVLKRLIFCIPQTQQKIDKVNRPPTKTGGETKLCEQLATSIKKL